MAGAEGSCRSSRRSRRGGATATFAVVAGASDAAAALRLAGITRDAVLTPRAKASPCAKALPLEVFASADEAFLTATSFPIAPIGGINGRAIPAPGPVTRRLIDRIGGIQAGGGASHEAWVMLAR
jgi:branched-subunit amino acid aminotransferase/4-amino-4-deoxychorismate lyase